MEARARLSWPCLRGRGRHALQILVLMELSSRMAMYQVVLIVLLHSSMLFLRLVQLVPLGSTPR